MFQIYKNSGQPDSTQKMLIAAISVMQHTLIELIEKKHVSVLFDRVALVRMGLLGPQGRRERRYDTVFINTASWKTPREILNLFCQQQLDM